MPKASPQPLATTQQRMTDSHGRAAMIQLERLLADEMSLLAEDFGSAEGIRLQRLAREANAIADELARAPGTPNAAVTSFRPPPECDLLGAARLLREAYMRGVPGCADGDPFSHALAQRAEARLAALQALLPDRRPAAPPVRGCPMQGAAARP